MPVKVQKVTGGCLCGAVRYEAEVLPGNAYYCHCTQCQKSSGQPFEIGVPVREGTLRFTGAEPKYYTSSPSGRRGFCAECGSRIVWRPTDPQEEWSTNVSPGSLDHPQDIRPNVHAFADTRMPWFNTSDNLPRVPEADMPKLMEQWKKAWSAKV